MSQNRARFSTVATKQTGAGRLRTMNHKHLTGYPLPLGNGVLGRLGMVEYVGRNCKSCIRRLRETIRQHKQSGLCATCQYENGQGCPYMAALAWALTKEPRAKPTEATI